MQQTLSVTGFFFSPLLPFWYRKSEELGGQTIFDLGCSLSIAGSGGPLVEECFFPPPSFPFAFRRMTVKDLIYRKIEASALRDFFFFRDGWFRREGAALDYGMASLPR